MFLEQSTSRRALWLAGIGAALLPASAWAAGSGVVGENLLWLALILMSARLFAPLAQRIGFPAVLGELLLGVVLGNLALFGLHTFESITQDPIIAFMAELGVIVLMLQIGLETRLADLVTPAKCRRLIRPTRAGLIFGRSSYSKPLIPLFRTRPL